MFSRRMRPGIRSGTCNTLERALQENHQGDPLDQLAALGAPTGDIDQVLAEIDAGRG